MANAANKAFDVVFGALGSLGGMLLCMLTFGIGYDVLARNIGLGGMSGSVELAEHLMYSLTFLAAPWVLTRGAHIRIDLLVTGVRPSRRRYLERVADLLGAMVCAVLAYYGALVVWASHANGNMIYQFLVFPEWWVLWQIPLAGVLMFIEFCRRLARTFGRQSPFQPDPIRTTSGF